MNYKNWIIDNSYYNDKLIHSIIEANQSMNNKTAFLDLNKSEYTFIEKYIYDIAMFHFSQKNITNSKDHLIEFWVKTACTTDNSLHIDCNEAIKHTNLIYPLFSCVTYINDNNCMPAIFTNIDNHDYKFKIFDKHTEILLSLPKKNKQVTFDGRYYHGCKFLSDNQNNERYIIAINIWNTNQITDINYYKPNDMIIVADKFLNCHDSLLSIQEENEDKIQTITVGSDIINYNFFNNLLYEHTRDVCYIFKKFIQDDMYSNLHTFIFKLDKSIDKTSHQKSLKNKYGDIIDDIQAIKSMDFNPTHNRFLQRFHYSNIFSIDLCNYIIKQSNKYAMENGGWTSTRHENFPTTDLPVNQIPSIFGIIMESFHTIFSKIRLSYNLPQDLIFNIIDLFIVKYEHNAQNSLDLHKDGSFLSINVLLNNSNDFEGGGTYFYDGLISYLEQGDLLVHSGEIKHAGMPITKGKRFLLVGFIQIELNE